MPRVRNPLKSDRTYYAWSNFDIPDPKNPKGWRRIKPGEEVTEGMFSSPNELRQMIEIGSVRTSPYPATRTNESPRTAQMREIRRMQEEMESGYNPNFDNEDEEVDEVEDESEELEDDAATS